MTRVVLVAPAGSSRDAVAARLAAGEVTLVMATSSWDDVSRAEADVVVTLGMPPVAALAETAVVVLSDDVERAAAVMRESAWPSWGVLPAGTPAGDLSAAVAAVASGFVVLPAAAVRRGLSVSASARGDEAGDEPLTPREHQVLELASEGLSNREMAAQLGISEHTVKFHLASVYGKLGASTRTEAVRRGLRRGVLTL